MSARQNFWARRQAAVAAEARTEQAALDAQAAAAEQAQFEGRSEEEVLIALNLPDPDTLGLGDDFTAFMAKAVPDQIRRRALRALWRSNPVLANVDMLVDYGEDFTDSAMAVENIQTAYQVGKGMLKHVQEMARQAEERAAPPADLPELDVDEVDEDVALAAVDADVQADTPVAAEADPARDQEIEETSAAAKPRRMKFRIEETA